jgi:hypothetical protein
MANRTTNQKINIMKNTLDYAKYYLLKTNFEFFTQSEQNVIGKTMVPYANHINEDLLAQNKEMLEMLEEVRKHYRSRELEQLIKKVKDNG